MDGRSLNNETTARFPAKLTELVISNLTKRFGNKAAVQDLSLQVRDGEFCVLLGPSGCGKTTLLRCIAGFETPESGEILFDGKSVLETPPRERDVSMVFQNYALFPHMKVRDNIAFPLQTRREPKPRIEKRVREIAELLKIEQHLEKMPKELSGGEQQRVALARAIVRQPKIFLMDEPLSNLDAPLRTQMRTMLKRVHREIGGTTVYVTHDQTEALSLADAMGVMNEGALLQYDAPEKIYSQPSNLFVAHFVGVLPSNLVDVTFLVDGTKKYLVGRGFRYLVSESISRPLQDSVGSSDLVLSVRPENVGISRTRSSESALEAKVNLVERMGNSTSVEVTTGGETMKVLFSSDLKLEEGERVWLDWPADKVHVFEKQSGKIIV